MIAGASVLLRLEYKQSVGAGGRAKGHTKCEDDTGRAGGRLREDVATCIKQGGAYGGGIKAPGAEGEKLRPAGD